jgi:rhodanese-related sulfurtransferase
MPIPQLTPEEAHTLLSQGYRYIDVRTEPEFANGHPAGAVNIPIAVPDPATGQITINPDFLSVVEAHFPKDAKIVCGCQSGPRSQRAAEMLAQAGFQTVVNMQGGFGGARDQMGRTITPGWSESGFPVCRDCGPENSYAGLRGAVK